MSWYHCYPQSCPSSDHCCCDNPCTGSCFSTALCGKGACCTCNEQQLGFAIANGTAAACNWSISCGGVVWFASQDCSFTAGALRVDTNGTPSRMADLTPALFTALGHNLSEGIFTAGADNSNSGSFTCICP